MIDWHSWKVRFQRSSGTIELDIEDEEMAVMMQCGFFKRRLGQLCATQLFSDTMKEIHENTMDRLLDERERYERGLRRIIECYPGDMDYPGKLARAALTPDRLRRRGLL